MKIFKIKAWRIVVCLLCLSFYADLNAQNSGNANKSSNLYLQVWETPNKKILVSWTPLDTVTFKQGLKQGYALSRYDSTTNQTTLLSDRILPQDTAAFFKLIRQDTTFTYYGALYQYLTAAKTLSNIRLPYTQIISNVHQDPQTAVLTGLGYIDTMRFTEGARYRYDLQLNGGSLATQVGMAYGDDWMFNTNGATFPTLDFGDAIPIRNYMPDTKPVQVFALAKSFGDSIYVRWAPSSYAGWVAGNKHGYSVRRFELTKEERYQKKLDLGIFKPLPLDSFAKEPFKSDTGSIIAAQALYGNNMTLSSSASLVDKADQSEMRFTVALQAADKSFQGCVALGLAFVDRSVVKGKAYVYEITHLDKGASESIIVNNNNDGTVYPPQDLQAQQGDHSIQLSWHLDNKKNYSMYRVQRSDDDGKTYNLITPQPLAYLFNGNETDSFRFTFVDSIPMNYKKYKYRLSGLDFFATWSPFAEVETFGRDLTPPRTAFITEGVSTTNSFELTWKLDSIDTDLAGFQIFMGNSMEGEFKPISKSLPKEQRQYSHRDSVNLTRSYYFKVVSMDTAGNKAYSGAHYVVVIDSIAPLTPKLARAKINKQGILRITWQHGTEADLAGYRVYSSTNNRDFVLKTPAPLDSNVYQDTLPLNTLNTKMYYKLLAEDQNGNQSPFTEVMMIQKPDTIVPVMPVIEQPESGGKGITLKWVPSSSTDVMAHLLYRKADKDTTAKWALIQTLDGQAERYTDTSAFIEKTYLYYIVAQDSTENLSESSLSVSGRRFFDGKSGGIQTLQAAFNKEQKAIQVSWQAAATTDPFLKDKDYSIFIYRATQNAPLEKYQQVEGKKLTSFTDDEVAKGQYRYAICMVYDDGKITPLTQEVVVEIE